MSRPKMTEYVLASWTKRAKPASGTPAKAKKATTNRFKPVPSEWDEQVATVAWFRAASASYGLDSRLLCASVNGSMLAGDARMRAIQASKLKKAGMVSGEPDLCLRVGRIPTEPPGGHVLLHGLHIEMKRSDWTPPKSGEALAHWNRQKEMHDLLYRQGYRVLVCVGADAAILAIRKYLGEL